ncbi:MAG: site-specific integrase [Coriobacteriales bacterium]|nr:site-specific integrase [Coriobacteriales bacterium]
MARVRKGRGTWRMVATVGGREVTADSGVACHDGSTRGKRTAQQRAEEWERGLRRGAAGRPSEATLADYCRAHVDTLLAMGQIERSTRRGYGTSLRYVADYFGDKGLHDVTTSDVEGFIVWLRDVRGLAQNTCKKTYNLLKSCMTHAVRSRELEWSPCDPIAAPRQRKVPPNALTEASRLSFVRHMRGLELTGEVTGVWVAYYTGMRRGEVCALQWRDVELRRGASLARVHGAIGVGEGGAYDKGTKNGDGRVVPVPDELAEILRARRATMLEGCMAMGVAFAPTLYVCGTLDGRWLSPPRLTRWFQAHRDEWGLMGTQGTPPTLHGLRHTYATEAVRALDVKTAQSILGHRQIQMTMEYADTDDVRVAGAAEAMGRALAAPGGQGDVEEWRAG